MSATVVVTLALGIGANAAIFSVVRGVLLRPLVNRGEDRLVYIRQSAPGIGLANTTFSMAEIRDFKSRAATVGEFGDFSTIDFTLLGLGEPRVVKAGVVNGGYFDVLGLRPVLGRLLGPGDDGPAAAPAVVLTYPFWVSAFRGDPTVVGRTLRLGRGSATIVGVLEPSMPYPADTEIIANVVTSPHHLSATMVDDRTHRMSELFGRLVPGASLEQARAELTALHRGMISAHPEAYSKRADVHLSTNLLRDQVTAPARPILLLLLLGAAIVFVIACSNVVNLILARSVRREAELAVRATLGASRGALRRTLLAESLMLCGAGAVLGLALAQPLVTAVSHFAARFSVRALEVTVDGSVLWVGAALAMAASVLLAYVPRLPGTPSAGGISLASASVRITPGTNRRLRLFATTQIACSFVLVAGAVTLIAALVALQTVNTGYDTRRVLALDVPPWVGEIGPEAGNDIYPEALRRIATLPGVEAASVGSVVPWRDAGRWAPWQFTGEGSALAETGEENPHGRPRFIAPGFFATLGIPILAGRDFTADDRRDRERVIIVSQSIAQRLFPNGNALDRKLWLTELRYKPTPMRIVGVVADVDDENVTGAPAMTLYYPYLQSGMVSRLFVRTSADPLSVVPSVTRILRELSPDGPIERPATLEDIRSQVLTPERMNAFVLTGFGGMALLIAVVGVAGVLAFSVSARIREFGIRLAIGSSPRQLLLRVLGEGTRIVMLGILAGAIGGGIFVTLAAHALGDLRLPHALPLLGAALVLVGAAVMASLLPAARAARIDVTQALRSE
jgi:predicted permease